MAKFKTIVTTVGAAKIAAVLAGTGSIVLDNKARMAVGDGNGTLPTPVPSQTALVHEVHRAALNSVSIDSSDLKNIVVELVIPPETGGFWIREMALYDAAGTLLAVGNMAETYKPSLSEGAGRKSVIRMVIAVSDVSAVTITMDSSTVMATKEYVDDKIDEHEKSRKHPDATLTAKGFTQLNSATDSASETQAATPKAVKAVMDAVKPKAPLDSPVFIGVPKVPTASANTSTQQAASTAFVHAAVAALINSSPATLDTLGELAAALGNDANFAVTIANALAGKQPMDATLTALAGLTNGANKLPYFTGQDTMAVADLSLFIRNMFGKGDAAAVLTYLGLGDAAKRNIGTSANQIPDMSAYTSGSNWRRSPDGYIEMWGVSSIADPTTGFATATFPIPFPRECLSVDINEVTNTTLGPSGVRGWGLNLDSISKTSVTAVLNTTGGIATGEIFSFRALGK
ncbi:TPA: phage tail protein [Citrobacter gillenii]